MDVNTIIFLSVVLFLALVGIVSEPIELWYKKRAAAKGKLRCGDCKYVKRDVREEQRSSTLYETHEGCNPPMLIGVNTGLYIKDQYSQTREKNANGKCEAYEVSSFLQQIIIFLRDDN